ncbi:MAG: NAD(P)-dependent oxidoreductase [Desulfobulbaceae bacterium]|jgi:nucleoside-diphosphate-sugar epimerase|nr:NAD(P)-dependent oxidoreductase [Desulfobulbaceae bacterium]MDY0351645.1 NAD(P)-dependent oxidoreductase [Desulfobulbaceae bacterium]
MKNEKLNCWEVKQCGRGPGSEGDGHALCPAAAETRLDSVHGGTNSGRACWVVAGTYCGGKVQGTHAAKYDVCKKCDFFQQVAKEEGKDFQRPLFLLSKLKSPSARIDVTTRRFGVLIGGSGLIGGALNHYFKTGTGEEIEILSPNSKKLSIRVPEDLQHYFQKYRPDFIINAAIASLDSDAQLSYETNYLGCVNLAKAAMALKIPFIHFSSAATLPEGENLSEDRLLPLTADLSNYAKSKLMAERTLHHLHETRGLDFTIVKLAVVYGKHDHKIQGFHRLLFSIAKQAMPVMLTCRDAMHSYTSCRKIPPFVHYLLENREEFSGQAYHFVDHNPVRLSQLILTIKSYLDVGIPKELYVSYPLAGFGVRCLKFFLNGLNRIGIEARMPPEMMFMESFYKTQTLSVEKLKKTSYGVPDPEETVFTELPGLIEYYITRWEHLNLVSSYNSCFFDPLRQADRFCDDPQHLLNAIHSGRIRPLADFEQLRQADREERG